MKNYTIAEKLTTPIAVVTGVLRSV